MTLRVVKWAAGTFIVIQTQRLDITKIMLTAMKPQFKQNIYEHMQTV